MNSDDHSARRFPPRSVFSKIPEGESYVELFEKYGRPFGPFDKERQLPYRAVAKRRGYHERDME